MSKNILTIDNLSKSYYTKEKEILAIDNISLNIKENTITAIVGPSGCGKSTLLNIIGNLDKKTKGEIKFFENKNKIGFIKNKYLSKSARYLLDMIKDKDF